MENKNQQQSKKIRSKANRYLYIAAAAVLCLGAILTGVLLSVRNRETPVNPDNVPAVTTPDDDPKEPDIDVTKILPEFVAPAVGLVTQSHDLDVLVFSKTENLWRVHRGIDISCKAGAAVMAAADGKVSEILDDPFFGKTVKITHNGEGVTIYSNLAAELAEGLEVGKEVKCGQVIGCVGETASREIAEEPHLHFEMTVAGKSVDPMTYISAESRAASLTKDTAYEG